MAIYKLGQTGGGGGATVLDDLTDVNTPAPGDGEVLTYKNPPGEWQPDTATAVVASLDDVGDVDVAAPNDGDVLTFNNGTGNWEAVAPTAASALDDLTDVDAPAPNDGDVLTYVNSTGNWEAVAPNTPAIALDDVTDVDAAAPSDGDVLTYVSGSGNWEPVAPASVRATGPDDPPASPSAYDDEFTGTSLDAKWTIITNTAGSVRYATTPSWLQAHFTGNQLYYARQAYVPGAGNAFSVTAKFSHVGFNAGNYALVALQVYADANNHMFFLIQWNSTTKASNINRTLAGVLTTNVQTRNMPASGHDQGYIHIQRNAGTSYTMWTSPDGVGWFPNNTTETAVTFAPDITEIGFNINQSGQTAYCYAGIDWIRVNWLTL